jgi:hypothetical protein
MLHATVSDENIAFIHTVAGTLVNVRFLVAAGGYNKLVTRRLVDALKGTRSLQVA